MPCILKAVIGYVILVVVSGSVGLFLRQALIGLRTHGRVPNAVFCFSVTAAYLWAVLHFWNISLAVAAFLIMLVVVEHYEQTPPWVRFTANAVLWGSSVLVWYSLCK